jgi:hypothetical protein
MKAGDQVRVYPHGSPDQAAIGEIVLLSAKGSAIAVSFGEKYVPFMTGATGMALHLEYGKMFLATRTILNGAAWGPWVESFNHGHYEIEEVAPP